MKKRLVVWLVVFAAWWFYHLIPLWPDEGAANCLYAAEADVEVELAPTPERWREHQVERNAIDTYFTLATRIRQLPYARIYLCIAERQRPTEWRVMVVVDDGTDLYEAQKAVSEACKYTMQRTGRCAGLRVYTVPESCATCREMTAQEQPTPALRQ